MLEKLEGQYAKAERDRLAAEEARERESAAHLAGILKKSVRQQFSHLEDEGLTTADRRQLRQRIAAEIPRPLPSVPLGSFGSGVAELLDGLPVFLLRHPVLLASLVGFLFCLGVALWNTTYAPSL